MIDPLINETIRHSVNFQQYSNYALAKIVRVLNLADADLMRALGDALADVDSSDFKIKRLDSLLKSVRAINAAAFARLYEHLAIEVDDYVKVESAFQEALYRGVVPVTFSIATVPVEQVYAAAMSTPFRGAILKDWASDIEAKRLKRIGEIISVGYGDGETTSDIIKKIRGTKSLKFADGLLDTSRHEVSAIVRTALSHTAQLTRNRFYDENSDILGDLVWIATLDGKTSSECRERDHLHYTQAHAPVGHNVPWKSGPGRLHWQCRSTSIAMLKGQKTLTGSRSSAGGYVDANLSYADWLKQQPAAMQDEALGGKKAGAAYRDGGMQSQPYSNNKSAMIPLKELAARDAKSVGG